MEDYKGQWPPVKICSIILAAGKSSRMGNFKPLLEVGGVPAVKRLIRSNKDAFIENIVIVTGHNREELEDSLAGEDVITAYNPDYEQGMFTSIKTGLRKAATLGDFDFYFLFLVDVPLIPANLIASLYLSLDPAADNFYVFCYEGKKGHPLIIPSKYLDEILAYDGPNGLKGVTNKYDDLLVRVDTDEEAVVLDMDVPEDYEEILAYFDKSKSPSLKKNILDETGFTGCLYLVRHGSTELHKEKIFMGQVDVPLSDEGRRQVGEAAETLAAEKPDTKVIYTSPLKRARESAEIIRDGVLRDNDVKDILETSAFMEMSLGDWDGRFISEIKEKFPEEYGKRGQNILTYKRDPDGENHYDLKYRVLKELKKIMDHTDPGGDIIIVSHKGVINVIRESILELDSMEARSYNPPKGSVTVIDTKSIR